MKSPIEVVRRFCAASSDNMGAVELAAFFTEDAVYHNIPQAHCRPHRRCLATRRLHGCLFLPMGKTAMRSLVHLHLRQDWKKTTLAARASAYTGLFIAQHNLGPSSNNETATRR